MKQQSYSTTQLFEYLKYNKLSIPSASEDKKQLELQSRAAGHAKSNSNLPYDLVILGMGPRKSNQIKPKLTFTQKPIYTWMFIIVFSIMAKIRNNPDVSKKLNI